MACGRCAEDCGARLLLLLLLLRWWQSHSAFWPTGTNHLCHLIPFPAHSSPPPPSPHKRRGVCGLDAARQHAGDGAPARRGPVGRAVVQPPHAHQVRAVGSPASPGAVQLLCNCSTARSPACSAISMLLCVPLLPSPTSPHPRCAPAHAMPCRAAAAATQACSASCSLPARSTCSRSQSSPTTAASPTCVCVCALSVHALRWCVPLSEWAPVSDGVRSTTGG